MNTNKPTTMSGLWAAARMLTICLAVVWGLAHQAPAATSVSGPVSDHWTTNGSPYLVVGDISVVDLTIDPGVQVFFQGPYVFEVDGILRASGAADNLVTFTVTNSGVRWNGIFFNQCNPDSFLNYCRVEFSTNSGVRIQDTAPTLRGCVIANNSAPVTGAGIWASLSSGTTFITGCSVTNNAVLDGSYANTGGGGIWVNGSAEIDCCTIAGNSFPNPQVGWGAGGVACEAGSTILRNTRIIGNSAAVYGGGMALLAGYARLENCLVVSNWAGWGGGGLLICGNGGTVDLVNCTVVGNRPEAINNGQISQIGSLCNVTNSIIYSNNSGGLQTIGVPAFDHCDVQGGVPPGSGNLSQNPVLDANFNPISPGSPCLDAGNPDPGFGDVCFPPSRGGVRNDLGWSGGPGACACLGSTAPIILQQPRGQSSCLGHSAKFTVAATGGLPLRYQWYFNSDPMNGRTNLTLILTNLQANQAGPYWVMVSNVFGTTNSLPAPLLVRDADIGICLYTGRAGLDIAGQQGSNYVLSYSPNLSNPNGWIPLATNLMGSSNWFHLDMDSCSSPRRFYKVQLQ